jgi:hypothetical protein
MARRYNVRPHWWLYPVACLGCTAGGGWALHQAFTVPVKTHAIYPDPSAGVERFVLAALALVAFGVAIAAASELCWVLTHDWFLDIDDHGIAEPDPQAPGNLRTLAWPAVAAAELSQNGWDLSLQIASRSDRIIVDRSTLRPDEFEAIVAEVARHVPIRRGDDDAHSPASLPVARVRRWPSASAREPSAAQQPHSR